jgi:hypothetical protein
MAALAAGAEFGQYLRINSILRADKAVEVEGICHGVHSA